MTKKHPLRLHSRYQATVIKPKVGPGKYPVAYTKDDGIFMKQIVFVGGDSDDLQPGDDIVIEITKATPSYAFAILITPNDQEKGNQSVST